MEKTILIFFAITFINVILSTTKSIMTIKASKLGATIINAVAYGFYAMVVKQMATVSTEIVVFATVICNLIGVYFSMWMLDKIKDKFKSDVLWKITVVPKLEKLESVRSSLVKENLGFYEYTVNTKKGQRVALDIFSETQEDSSKVKNILNKNGNVKYHILRVKDEL